MDHHKRSQKHQKHTNQSKHTYKKNTHNREATNSSNKPKPITSQQRIHKIIDYETRQMNKMLIQIQLQQ